jgi:hypothetical protein
LPRVSVRRRDAASAYSVKPIAKAA